MKKVLHIISFDVPYPPDYGGIIDVFYRIKNLSEKGVDIILHCFQYGRPESDELKRICKEVHFYKRKSLPLSFLSTIPLIVESRVSEKLLQNLLLDNHPILFEGTHCTYLLNHPALQSRKRVVRAHNIEETYYANLAKEEKNIFKKLYFHSESKKLHSYERNKLSADLIITVNEEETKYFKGLYPQSIVKKIYSFTPLNEVKSLEGSGDYILYHGNLSIPENINAVKWLTENVFLNLPFQLTVAGKNPDASLIELHDQKKIKLIANPSEKVMNELIRNAHINLLYVKSGLGLRLKLLYALFLGRHCLINTAMAEGNLLGEICEKAETAEDFKKKIAALMNISFTTEKINHRREFLNTHYSNSRNTEELINLIF